MEKNCPNCENHCPVEELRCPEGKKYFGVEDKESEKGPAFDQMPETAEGKVIMALRRCGHYLHHNAGKGGNAADAPDSLLASLTEEEKQILAMLLEKCTKNL